MKHALIAMGVVVCAGLLWAYFDPRLAEDPAVTSVRSSVSQVPTSISEQPLMAPGPDFLSVHRGVRREVAQSGTLKKSRRRRLDAEFEYSEIPNSHLLLVTNQRAVVPSQEVGGPFRGGFELAPVQTETELNLFADKRQGRFLVWTREVILRGGEQELGDLAQRFHLEALRNGIYRVPESSGVRELLERARILGLEVELDLNSARVVAQ